MNVISEFKLFLIYCYEFFEENDAKLFNEMVRPSFNYPYKFQEHTPEENKKYLLDWKRQNGIRLGDFEYVKTPKYNKYGTPFFIKRIRGEFRKCDFDVTDAEA